MFLVTQASVDGQVHQVNQEHLASQVTQALVDGQVRLASAVRLASQDTQV